MKTTLFLCGLVAPALLVGACDRRPARSAADEAPPVAAVAATDAWCRPSPNGAQAGACYVTLISETDDRLMGGSTPGASDLQVHDMSMEGGMMRMNRMGAGLPLSRGQAVMLAPGGKHLMLIGLTLPLVAGETVPLTLEFAAAPPVTIDATVGQGPAGMSH